VKGRLKAHYQLPTQSFVVASSLTTKAVSPSEQIFEREKDIFLQIKPKLLNDKDYSNKFVAIINGKIADSDSDRSALVERVYSRFGYIPLYIGQVTTTQKRYRRLPSPRRV
jgi:hypothetical protein